MAGTLTFAAREIARIVDAAKKAKAHRLSYNEQWDDNMHKGGVVKLGDDGQPDLNNIDPSKVGPKLWLVKDRGVCLMSNGVVTDTQRPAVTYADGLSPKDDYYDLARQIMGGDDCVEALPLDDFEDLLDHGADVIEIHVTESSIAIAAMVPAKSEGTKKPPTRK